MIARRITAGRNVTQCVMEVVPSQRSRERIFGSSCAAATDGSVPAVSLAHGDKHTMQTDETLTTQDTGNKIKHRGGTASPALGARGSAR